MCQTVTATHSSSQPCCSSSSHSTTSTATSSFTEEGDEGHHSALTSADNENARIFSKECLNVLNVLTHPVWVFDIDERCMAWANHAAVELWNATSLKSLLARDFSDMSEATAARLKASQALFDKGESMNDQWTYYPKGKAKTVHVTCSGVKLVERHTDADIAAVAHKGYSMLCEGVPQIKEVMQAEIVRGVEMLRHLPIAVCQFDMKGQCMFQNPEAMNISTTTKPHHHHRRTYSTKEDAALSTTNASMEGNDNNKDHQQTEAQQRKEEQEPRGQSPEQEEGQATSEEGSSSRTEAASTKASTNSDFLYRFVDRTLGRKVLEEMTEKDYASFEASIYTRHGPRWCAVQVRKAKDPVTSEDVVLFSARDMSDALWAKQERKKSSQKSEFFAVMAHEIRTPLHQVTGFIDLLGRTPLNPEQKGFVKLLKSSANGLMTVISDVLDYSKLEAGKMKIETIKFEPKSVVETSIAAVKQSCDEKNIHLALDWHTKIPFQIAGDPNRLRQILLNLLSNAVKFTPAEGSISVHAKYVTVVAAAAASSSSCAADKNANERSRDTDNQKEKQLEEQQSQHRIRFVVKDSGIGVSAGQKTVIFRKYQQANVSIARNYGGTGLGLSICKLLVTTMGGSIGVDSEVGHGSSFWFELPARDFPHGHDEEESSDDDGDQVGPEDPQENMTASFSSIGSPRGLSSSSNHTSSTISNGLNVLVAEDNKVNQKLVSFMLQKMGHTVTMTENGKEAVQEVEDMGPGYYDVVLMDIQMPVMDGLEATRRLRSQGHDTLPIFGLTASVQRSDFEELGFTKWISKPVRMKELKTQLQSIMNNQLLDLSNR